MLALIGELLRVGMPVGVAIFAEGVAVHDDRAVFGRLRRDRDRRATVALNSSSGLFMLPLSLGMALNVRVGQALGTGTYRHARFVTFDGVAWALAAAFVIDLIILVGGSWAVSLCTGNVEIQRLALQLLIATL
ncbi:MATE family efflux transporter [Stutzerimonas stutzeri]|uniref:MATE family efflux transporter n=1 Tax=Stutzerimonas stutzeri TaxID=316 RepID=UPI0021099841|nr:MATE family efflux transporter [Stutzerimonas stutzeri]MCQ4321084.1 MATE family efflux transporter [Stutzerimonas stutzeri]